MDDTLVLFRFTDNAFGITGWGVVLMVWTLTILYFAIRFSGRN